MEIRNQTKRQAHYRLSGGPTDMTFSEADLDPGESDQWDPPPFIQQVMCHVHFSVDGENWIVAHSTSSGTVSLLEDNGVLSVLLE